MRKTTNAISATTPQPAQLRSNRLTPSRPAIALIPPPPPASPNGTSMSAAARNPCSARSVASASGSAPRTTNRFATTTTIAITHKKPTAVIHGDQVGAGLSAAGGALTLGASMPAGAGGPGGGVEGCGGSVLIAPDG